MYKVDERSERWAGINYVNSRCSCDASLSLSFSLFVLSYAERIGMVRRANRAINNDKFLPPTRYESPEYVYGNTSSSGGNFNELAHSARLKRAREADA